MYIRKGSHRIVIVFPILGIAVKFALIRVISLAKNIFLCLKELKNAKWKALWIEIITSPMSYEFGVKGTLFHGIADNWKEFIFFQRTKHPFLQPTYFSFFGLFNIQKAGQPCNIFYKDLWVQMHEITNGMVWESSHHFGSPENFCFDGKLRILDYGDPRTHGIIKKFGLKIMELFDPNCHPSQERKNVSRN